MQNERTRILLTPYDNALVGRYSNEHKHVHAICDTTIASFSVQLPDGPSAQEQEFIFSCVGSLTNTATINASYVAPIFDGSVSHVLSFGDTVTVVWGGEIYRKWLITDVNKVAIENVYGSMYCEDAAISVAVAVAHNYYDIASGLSNGGSNGMTFQNSKEIKCLTAGNYLVTWSLSIRNSVSDNTIEGIIKVSGIGKVNTGNATRAKENGVVYSVSGSGIITLAVNDIVRFGVENEDGASTITVSHATMTLSLQKKL